MHEIRTILLGNVSGARSEIERSMNGAQRPNGSVGWRMRSMAFCLRTFLVLFLVVFVSDVVNVDILLAASTGSFHFVDDPTNADSTFNHCPTSLAHSPSSSEVYEAMLHGPAHFVLFSDEPGCIQVLADADSPSLLDAVSSATLTPTPFYYAILTEAHSHEPARAVDRTVAFQQFLI